MKTIYNKLLFLLLIIPAGLFAQGTIGGIVTDGKTNQPMPGVNVVIQGTTTGTSTDFDGKFVLNRLKKGDKIVFSFIGYQNGIVVYNSQTSLNVSLIEEANQLEEVKVQVGYGSVKKKDATGSVSIVSSKDFNKGAIMSADQLLVGKTPGVRITTNGGAPDSDPNIRIRGGSSISGENRPLIVIDGVPIDNQNAAGNGNPLSLINPNDIESFSILKDASSTAIYGSRASNGVIIITTKRGTSGKPQFNFSSTLALGKVSKYLNVMDGETFSKFIETKFPTFSNYLGYSQDNTSVRINDPSKYTNWQKVIYRNSISSDNTFSVRANLFNVLPARFSVGYNKMEGLVRNNDYDRKTASVKLNPSFFDKTLKIDINAKGIISRKNDIDAGGAIGSAVSMDPTKPIYGYSPGNRFVGYYQDFILNSNRYNTNGATNPLALIEQVEKPVDIRKVIGNIELDYKLPFLSDVRLVTNLGLEASSSKQKTIFKDNSLATYSFTSDPADPNFSNPDANYFFNSGESYFENQSITNKTADVFLIYSKKWKGFITKFDSQAGHTFQEFVNDGYKRTYQNNILTGVREEQTDPNTLVKNRYYQVLTMESYFYRTNMDFKNKYLLTFSFRADASSLFPKDRRWGYFPALALAWKLKEEKFLKDSNFVNDLKLRIGYGKTGNSDIRGIAGYYPYSAFFAYGSNSGQYLPGVNSYTALPFNPNLTWENTSTYNVGIDYDLFKKGLITGAIDIYYRKTNNLLAKVPQPPGQLLSNEFVSNIGSTSGKGIEFLTNIKLIDTEDYSLNFNGNFAYNIVKVDDLNGNDAITEDSSGLPIQTGTKLAYYKIGEQPFSAWVFEQVYDNSGQPIQNVFVDRNKDGAITDADRYFVALRPNWTYGFGLSFSLKKLEISTSLRGQVGGKVYNAVLLNKGNQQTATPSGGTSVNNVLNIDLPFSNVNGNIPYSDYFLSDASFLRCESLNISYKFKGFTKESTLTVSTGVNNLFLITRYKGQDPENFNAIDNNFYPRPLITNFGINYNF